MKTEIIEKLTHLAKEYVAEMPEVLAEETKLRTELGLSSFELVSMIGDVEDEFDIEFPDEDIPNIITIGDMVEYIISKQA